ncbi:MAG: DUF4199 domain-containing protein [Prevotellaceae bacterium]|nr:DUF4199 domain-containing protein [Prevotellaceae bacterium]
MEINEYRQLKAFAVQDGTILGLIWVACFACFIGQLKDPSFSFLWMALSVFSVGFAFIRVKKFGKKVREGDLPFVNAWIYTITMLVCACLLMAISNYVYFAYIDKGFLTGTYMNIFESEESKAVIKAYKIDTKTFNDAVKMMAAMSPMDWTINILSTNMTVGLILSPLVALYARQKRAA